MPTVTNFDSVRLTNVSIQYIRDTGVQLDGKPFGFVGTLETETEMMEFIKRVEGVEVNRKTKPVKMSNTITGHIPVEVARELFGLSNDQLKIGVYAYGANAKNLRFALTADVIDEFQDITKIIAFPNCVNDSGFKISIENGADELAELEIEFTALQDANGNFYYEAITDELEPITAASFISEWHRNFSEVTL